MFESSGASTAKGVKFAVSWIGFALVVVGFVVFCSYFN